MTKQLGPLFGALAAFCFLAFAAHVLVLPWEQTDLAPLLWAAGAAVFGVLTAECMQ